MSSEPSAGGSDPRRPGARLVTAAQVLLTLAGVLYLGVVVEAAAGWPLDPARSYLSELAALDQATSPLFRSTDVAAGTLVVVGLALLGTAYRLARHEGEPAATIVQKVTFWAFVVFGLATVADALLPLDCALSVGDCAAREEAGELSLAHQAHTFSSVASGVSSFVASAGVVWLAHARRRTPLGISARLAGALGPLLGVVTGTIGLFGSPLPVGTGIVQRVQIVAFSVVLVLAVQVLTLRQRHRGAPETDVPQDGTARSPASHSEP
ncbi:DUF998 domain-containing protein [Oerskovia enterophila]|uniref:DUF998 domain-containing protein n=1 Tax=Oerskovia enterophila TaxID=43678 RepID=A0A163RTB3_9CELL|nr:DUF998 domain-containing protein [Oerskovia enterophila]KZM35673.1 hypothetical protein OJAG_16360 [Oerskovia enterophila]